MTAKYNNCIKHFVRKKMYNSPKEFYFTDNPDHCTCCGKQQIQNFRLCYKCKCIIDYKLERYFRKSSLFSEDDLKTAYRLTINFIDKYEPRMTITEASLDLTAIAIALLERYQDNSLLNQVEEDIKNLHEQSNIEYVKSLSYYSNNNVTTINNLIVNKETGEIVKSLHEQCDNAYTYDADATIKFSRIFKEKFKLN